jgi:hypothetical protein
MSSHEIDGFRVVRSWGNWWSDSGLDIRLSVYEKDASSTVLEWVNAERNLVLGDAQFDSFFRVACRKPERLVSLMTPYVRGEFIDLNTRFRLQVRNDNFVWRHVRQTERATRERVAALMRTLRRANARVSAEELGAPLQRRSGPGMLAPRPGERPGYRKRLRSGVGWGLSLERRGFLQRITGWTDLETDVPIGVREFDDYFRVRSNNLEASTAALSPWLCRELIALHRNHGLRVRNDVFSWPHYDHKQSVVEHRIQTVIATLKAPMPG